MDAKALKMFNIHILLFHIIINQILTYHIIIQQNITTFYSTLDAHTTVSALLI